ncbi:XrtA/PEP-CTERM system-associated ATPase [Desulfovulcanus sp.]
MYLDFYGFKKKPFNIVPDPSCLYPSSKHRLALTYLEYGLTENIGFILLTGEIGTGKTTLIRHLLDRVSSDTEVAVIFNTNVSADELVKLVLQEFEIQEVSPDKSINLDRLNTFLIEQFGQGKRCLLIIDEAQNLSKEALEEVRLFSNLQTETVSLLQIILVGQPELKHKLQDPALAQLTQRIAVTYHLGPLSQEETYEYIAHRIKAAGCENQSLFTPEALAQIYKHSRGIPRLINILCDTALVYGYADEAQAISEEIVNHVIADREESGFFQQDTEQTPSAQNTEQDKDIVTSQPELKAVWEKINLLESKIEKLATIVDWQVQELKGQVAERDEKVILKLESLLKEERKKSDSLLYKCTAYQKEIKQLKEELASRSTENRQKQKEEKSTHSSRSGIFKYLFK